MAIIKDPFAAEPAFKHDVNRRTGVLLINLGTPAAPTAAALRPYLRQFLSDPRVVELPRWLWWPILNGVILNTRPKKSAEKYASIWQKDGSPLLLHTRAQAKLLQGFFGDRLGLPVRVEYAMRYGEPAVARQIQQLKAEGCDRVLIAPLYPQYASSATGSALDAVWSSLAQQRNPPEIRVLKQFHDHPAYIDALAAPIEAHWRQNGRPEHLLLSFHGVPRFSLERGDPYFCQCQKTGRLLAERLGLDASRYSIAFQSRFGRAEWLKPYTSEVLATLGRKLSGRLDVACPGFVADCLETLEEIAIEGRALYKEAGGKDYHYLPCLNAAPAWIHALAQICEPHLRGWLPDENSDNSSLRQQRAMQLGAKQ